MFERLFTQTYCILICIYWSHSTASSWCLWAFKLSYLLWLDCALFICCSTVDVVLFLSQFLPLNFWVTVPFQKTILVASHQQLPYYGSNHNQNTCCLMLEQVNHNLARSSFSFTFSSFEVVSALVSPFSSAPSGSYL